MADKESFKPIYRQIREDLLRRFEQDPEGKLPSEREICRQYGVCRPTVHKALDYFIENGLIVRRPGKGSFFRGKPAEGGRPRQVRLVIRGDWRVWTGDSYFGLTVQGICSSLTPHGVGLAIEQYSERLRAELAAAGPVATVWLAPELAEEEAIRELADAGNPVTVVNRPLRYPGVSFVSSDHAGDGRTAAEYARSKGFARICYFISDAERHLADARLGGMRDVPGIAVEPRIVPGRDPIPAMCAIPIPDDAFILLNSEALFGEGPPPGGDPARILLFSNTLDPLRTGIGVICQPVAEIGRLAGLLAGTGALEFAGKSLPGRLYAKFGDVPPTFRDASATR